MESTTADSILKLHPDTIQYVRKQYDLDKPGRIDESIDLLVDWIKKEKHLLKKDYSRDYLERTIIFSKGSMEKAKSKLDKISTFRTIMPKYFEIFDVKKSVALKDIYDCFLPRLTKDHYRVYMLKNVGQRFSLGFLDYYKYLCMQCEYLQTRDYCNGAIVLLDYTEADIMEIVKSINLLELKQILAIVMEGYGMRIKGIHLLTMSSAIEAFIMLFKQAVSAKIAKRIQVHKKLETLYEFIPQEILPIDFGGQEKSLKELNGNFMNVATSEEFMKYYKEMSNACTDETNRQSNGCCDEYLGVSGSFRTLSID